MAGCIFPVSPPFVCTGQFYPWTGAADIHAASIGFAPAYRYRDCGRLVFRSDNAGYIYFHSFPCNCQLPTISEKQVDGCGVGGDYLFVHYHALVPLHDQHPIGIADTCGECCK